MFTLELAGHCVTFIIQEWAQAKESVDLLRSFDLIVSFLIENNDEYDDQPLISWDPYLAFRRGAIKIAYR